MSKAKSPLLWSLCALLLLTILSTACAQHRPFHDQLPDIDKRAFQAGRLQSTKALRTVAANRLKARVPEARVDLSPNTGTAAWIGSPYGPLTGPNGQGKAVSDAVAATIPATDKDRAVKAFLKEYQGLFGHGPEALSHSTKSQDTPNEYGVHRIDWVQELDGLQILGAQLKTHLTRDGALLNISGSLVADPSVAADTGTPDRHRYLEHPQVSPADSVVNAARDLGVQMDSSDLAPVGSPTSGPERRAFFESPMLRGTSRTWLVWLRTDLDSLRLCWQVFIMARTSPDYYRVIVDALTGEVLVRTNLTFYDNSAHTATYAYYPGSPMPMRPGLSSPSATLPSVVPPHLRTLRSLNATASPMGWIPDHIYGPSEPFDNMLIAGRNVVAYYADNFWLEGYPYRVFNPALSLSSTGTVPSNTTNWEAGVVNAFYWGNILHDRLWDAGFAYTIAYGYVQGYYQYDPWEYPDPVYIITRDHSVNYDYDGFPYYTSSPHAHYEPYNGVSPVVHLTSVQDPSGGYRDHALDTETIIHEVMHLVTCRLVFGGSGSDIERYDVTLRGLLEGTSDFYALTFLSDPYEDNPNGQYGGTYPYGAFGSIGLAGEQGYEYAPYYYGIRRMPYSTDTSKNPLTIADIISFDVGSTYCNDYWNAAPDYEPHNAGEVWCSILWDLRAKMIQKVGDDDNATLLKLITVGIDNLPLELFSWVTARDAILQADTVVFGGRFRQEIWEAFAGRMMGADSRCDYYTRAEGSGWYDDIYEDSTIGADPGTTNQVAAPEFAPVGGWYENAQSVAITCDTSGATIRYTTDGTDPTTSSTQYTTPIAINATTVLKAKAWYGTDSPSRIRENLYTIRPSIPWQRTDGAQVSFRGNVSAIFTVGSEKWIYIEHPDRLWGIRVVADASIPASLFWVMDVQGTVHTDLDNGEKYVLADTGYPVRYGTGIGLVIPLGMRNQWLGGDAKDLAPSINEAFGYYNVGMLVRSWGAVRYTNATEGIFVMDDGSALTDPIGIGYGGGKGVRVKLPSGATMPTVGTYVRVMGISSTTKAYPSGAGSYYVRLLRPRTASDIQTLNATYWHTMQIPLTCEQWNYFSLPGIPKQPEPWYMMPPCPTGGSVWLSNNLYRWDAPYDYWCNYGDGCQYMVFGNFLVGDGYKFFHDNPGDPNFTCASCFTFEHADSVGDQFISLPNGSLSLPTTTSHSLIGNPFHTSRAWANMKVTDGNTIKTLPQAVTDGWIHAVKVWEGTTLTDVNVFGGGGMETLKAYEVYPKYDNMALIIPGS